MPSESLRSDGIFVWVMYGRSRVCQLARRSGIGGELLADSFTTSVALAAGYDVVMVALSWVLYDFVVS